MLSWGKIAVGARASRLSKAQVQEVLQELQTYNVDVAFDPIWIPTTGDLDRTTSLRTMDKTDFFTKEIDDRQLQGEFRISIHSAKDLPESIRPGLNVVAITEGLDPSDSLVYNQDPLPLGAKIGVSSIRREEVLRAWRSDLVFCDVRGNIEERIEMVDKNALAGVVIATCALERLEIRRKRMVLAGATAPLQGKLAIVARSGDTEMEELFACLDTRSQLQNSPPPENR